MDGARVDAWLWAVRLFKSRSAATAACKGGHVKINGVTAKAATSLKVGDRVDALVHGDRRSLEVVRLIAKRVGAPVAVECYVDHSPPRERDAPGQAISVRDRGAGRPTKRERRQIDKLRGRG
jgi:ribosome-associated heat shock protein Hsp15